MVWILELAGHALVERRLQVVQAAQSSRKVVPSVAIIGSVPSTISAHSSPVVNSAAMYNLVYSSIGILFNLMLHGALGW